MFLLKILLCYIFLFSFTVISIQFNLHLTEWTDNNEVVQHDCLRVDAWEDKKDIHEITSYCMSKWPSKWTIKKNSLDQEYNFAELSKLNITSEQLYLWSAPMDTIENYQFYLNQLSISNQTLVSPYSYVNCTLPKFGPLCQYSFDEYKSDYSSLNNIIEDSFRNKQSKKVNQTCYTHLQCNLGTTSLCIGWINICDGLIHCIDGIDEEPCWQLEINDCTENEFRCQNGQCIPLSFLNDNEDAPDCLDGSDEKIPTVGVYRNPTGPLFKFEEISCAPLFPNKKTGPLFFRTWCEDAYILNIDNLAISDKPNSMSDICWSALTCYLRLAIRSPLNCIDICDSETCKQLIKKNCPDMFYMPNTPIAFGHIYFAYTKDYIVTQDIWTNEPEYVCYNEQLCDGFDSNKTLYTFNNTTCRRPQDFPFRFEDHIIFQNELKGYVLFLYVHLYKCNTIRRNDSTFCNNSTMYQCINSSKCIAQIRLFDGRHDCDYGDDELWISTDHTCPIKSPRMYVTCTKKNTCISRKLLANRECDCEFDIYGMCDDEPKDFDYFKKHISFPNICNNITDLMPMIIDQRNETDETGCEQWPCNNIYTRCNGIWNCLNGDDEVDCHPSSLINCPPRSYVCFSPETVDYICLSTDKLNDNNIDCLGAIDEPYLCQRLANQQHAYQRHTYRFYCDTPSGIDCLFREDLCNKWQSCTQGEDEKFCHHIENPGFSDLAGICENGDASIRSDVEEFLCHMFISFVEPPIVHFSLDKMRKPSEQITKRDTDMLFISSSNDETADQNFYYCHRSLNLRLWLNNDENRTEITCLCPPSYYGDRCQYQNERVSLIIQFRAFSDSWQTPFIVVVLLIDNGHEGTIHSYEQFTYLPVPNCKTKYNIDLLYSTRPKNHSKQYSIHIDIYEQISLSVSLSYRGSLLMPLLYPFLPVQKIAIQLHIPHTGHDSKTCLDPQCVHGQCIRYFDDPKNSTFCQCQSGWSGRYCTIPHNCTCSSDSLCIGKLANNRSLCICPVHKWGSRCLLHNQVCQGNVTCHNGGQCIPTDRYITSNRKKFTCICPKGFFGEICEIPENKIILSFEKGMILPQSMLIHFIEVKDNAPPENGTTFKTIPIDRNPVTIYWSRIFHIAFVEFILHNYYLIVVQNLYNQSKTIETTLKSSDLCPNISEVFNDSFFQLHLLRRIKYYHLPCQQQSPQLSCFYDDVHLCLCQDFDHHQRVANCFEFDHRLQRNCRGQSNCINDAQCLQDSVHCPETSMCVCRPCFYGARCQFSSNGFGLSLDAILGNYIQPHVNIRYQPTIVQISLTLTVLMTVMGLLNGICSLMTFMGKEPRKIGCGFYLIGSSITTLITTILFFIKFLILLIAQMTYMTNQSFLSFQCRSIDFILRVGLHMDQWLNACVAMERAITAVKGVNFDKRKSKAIAKFVIPLLLLLTSSTNIYEILNRRVIDDNSNDEKRFWCIVEYSANVQKYNLAMNILHFCIPFVINLFSAIIIIIKTARLRTTAKTQQNYRKILLEQLRQHKHLLITPILLVIFAIPRLIISFVSGCMQTAADAWLFLIGYFISFIPPICIFFIFVAPSKTYKQEFYNTFRRYQRRIQTRFRLVH